MPETGWCLKEMSANECMLTGESKPVTNKTGKNSSLSQMLEKLRKVIQITGSGKSGGILADGHCSFVALNIRS